MFNIGNVLQLKSAGKEKQGGKEQVAEEEESHHYCDGERERAPFYPQLETCGSFVTCKTRAPAE